MIPIVPALIPTSAEQIRSVLAALSFSPEIHIDVVDGNFVPFVSWPYTEEGGDPIEVHKTTDRFTLEVDLMVQSPLMAADSWLTAGADMLVFHTETIDLAAFTRFVESTRISIGICANNDTPLEVLVPYIEVADYIQLMGIAKIGSQGQPLDERVFERIAELKVKFPKHPITVDGSVNKETIVRLAKVGADRFICGSAIVGASNPEQAHLELAKLIQG